MRVKVHRRGQVFLEDKNIGISLWKGRDVPFSTVWDRRTAEPAVIIPSTIVIIVFLFRTQYCIAILCCICIEPTVAKCDVTWLDWTFHHVFHYQPSHKGFGMTLSQERFQARFPADEEDVSCIQNSLGVSGMLNKEYMPLYCNAAKILSLY